MLAAEVSAVLESSRRSRLFSSSSVSCCTPSCDRSRISITSTGTTGGALAVNADRRLLIQLAVAIAAVALVVASGLVTTGEAVTSKPLVAVQVDEFSVFPGRKGHRGARCGSWSPTSVPSSTSSSS